MAASIQLLGVPQIVMPDDSVVVLRGHKAWGLLAYLDPNGEGDHSMPDKQRTPRRRRRWVVVGPA